MRVTGSILHVLVEIGVFLLWAEIISAAVALPGAWLKVRRTQAWPDRPAGVGRIGLLRRFTRPIPFRAGLLALLPVLLFVGLGWLLGIEEVSPGVALAVICGFPAALAIWAVGRLDAGRFEAVVSEAAAATRPAAPAASDPGSPGPAA